MSEASRRAAAAALAVAIAVPAEGLRQWAYRDPPGILTVCYGHTGPDVNANREYSLVECRSLLTADMAAAIDTVERCVPGLPVRMLAAWGDAVFNLGGAIVCDVLRSTAARLLKAGHLLAACAELSRWNKARVLGVLIELPGLTKRRAAERAMCEGGAP